jgi:hypothetical protein
MELRKQLYESVLPFFSLFLPAGSRASIEKKAPEKDKEKPAEKDEEEAPTNTT